MDSLGLFQQVVHQYHYNHHCHHPGLYCLLCHPHQYQAVLEDLLGRRPRYRAPRHYHHQDQSDQVYHPGRYPLYNQDLVGRHLQDHLPHHHQYQDSLDLYPVLFLLYQRPRPHQDLLGSPPCL